MFLIDYITIIKMRTNVQLIQLVQDISLKVFGHETYDSNPFSGFGYGLLNLLIKCQLRIECQAEMFMFSNCLTMMSLKDIGGWADLFLW